MISEATFTDLETDLWDLGGAVDALCVTTNGDVKKSRVPHLHDGYAVMGRGVALQAARIHLGVEVILAKKIRENGLCTQIIDGPNWNEASYHPYYLVSVPVKYHWRDRADVGLIATSLAELVELTDRQGWRIVCLPRPGCGNGGLRWETDVRELCETFLDDRFLVVHRDGSK